MAYVKKIRRKKCNDKVLLSKLWFSGGEFCLTKSIVHLLYIALIYRSKIQKYNSSVSTSHAVLFNGTVCSYFFSLHDFHSVICKQIPVRLLSAAPNYRLPATQQAERVLPDAQACVRELQTLEVSILQHPLIIIHLFSLLLLLLLSGILCSGGG